MKAAMRLFLVVLVTVMERTGGVKPNNGYCIGNSCFTVFHRVSDFTAAQSLCADEWSGHLMTVRSSVSNDIILTLLENFSGPFWIGLHLVTGCPDASAELKGFQWVTKDNKSDFFNWAPDFDSSCSSHRCVSVSTAGELKWTRESCGKQAAGFLCEVRFTDGCRGLTDVPQHESVAYTTPLGFDSEDLLSLPPGSIAVRSLSGSKFVCDSGRWLQGPWSCEIHNGGCEFKCAVNSRQVPICSCPRGQTVDDINKVTCTEYTSDPCVSLDCDYICQHEGESYKCACDHGFRLAEDGKSCEDLDECADKRQCPWDNFRCVNKIGNYECVCAKGYELSGRRCVDEDECVSAPCEHVCTNTPGSYKCTCYPGYRLNPETQSTCELHCGAEECPAECDPNDELRCYCPSGYISEERDDGQYCLDIDECSSDFCDQRCENTFGGFVCSCNPGYTLVKDFMCLESDDHAQVTTEPNVPATPFLPHPDPTRKPSAVSVGGLFGIIVCAVLCVGLLVFLVHYIFNRRLKTESARALKAHEGEAHGLERVASDK